MKKTLFIVAALGMIIFDSCKDSTTEPTKTKTEMLTQGQWLMLSGTIVPPITIDVFGQTITISDYFDFAAAQPCDRDDLRIFNADGTITDDEGPTKCNAGDPQTQIGGSWSFMDNESKLRIIQDADTLDLTITELTSASLKGTSLLVNDADTVPTNHVLTLSFKNNK